MMTTKARRCNGLPTRTRMNNHNDNNLPTRGTMRQPRRPNNQPMRESFRATTVVGKVAKWARKITYKTTKEPEPPELNNQQFKINISGVINSRDLINCKIISNQLCRNKTLLLVVISCLYFIVFTVYLFILFRWKVEINKYFCHSRPKKEIRS